MASLLSLLLPAACGAPRSAGAPVPVVDFARKLDAAERRPASGTFALGEFTFGDRGRASVVVPAESRLTWIMPVPHRATLRFYAAVPPAAGDASVSFRVGISDNRRYETLAEHTITSADTAARGWIPVAVDLSAYAGRKFSLFYRPDRIRWRIVIGTHVLAGAPGVVYLGEPAITTDVDAAHEYAKRIIQQE